MKTIFLSLLLLCFVAAYGKNQCVSTCLQSVCSAEEDQKQCTNDIYKESICIKEKCSPKFQNACVSKCCTSNVCQQMLSCSVNCGVTVKQISQIDLSPYLLPPTQRVEQHTHFLKKRNEISADDEVQQVLNNTFSFSHKTSNKGNTGTSHNSNKTGSGYKRHRTNSSILSLTLSVLLSIFVLAF